MKAAHIRRWQWLHTWSSLVCTVFALMLCVTGLPLIFADEIEATLHPNSWVPANPGGEWLTLDRLLRASRARYPGESPIYMSFDIERPVVNITTARNVDAPASAMRFSAYDRSSGEPAPTTSEATSILEFLLQLHTDMFLGLPGMLFLGAMGVLLFLATVSGAVLYLPFMRRLHFATVRESAPRRTRWLDFHNFFGAISLIWVATVATTGVFNTLEQPIVETWRARNLEQLVDSVSEARSRSPVAQQSSLDAAVAKARELAPGMHLQFIAFPGSEYSSNAHYAVFFHGDTPLTQHMITPVLVHAERGTTVGLQRMPWYFKLLSLSRPLHFGDYGGLALKLVWALLDLIAIAILTGGLYLWWMRRRGEGVSRGRGVSAEGLAQPPDTSGQRRPPRMSARRVFRVPATLALLTAIGLLGALVVEGRYDMLFSSLAGAGLLGFTWRWRETRRKRRL